uniref:LEF-2 n=1 Tax=Spodoptera frugiperda nuclear polyhedrosis virus TaxID=10455 RepID=A0A891XLD3_NPVSF|nr:LEF-2 [Spodoptera frugiperda multiple nucleopolyhedrovirus]
MAAEQLLSWTPSNIETIDKNSDYSVLLSDVPSLQVTALTPFLDNGLRVKINGLRLFYVIKNSMNNNNDNHNINMGNVKVFKGTKSKKNVCFAEACTKSEIVQVLQRKLNMPDCMQKFLMDFQVCPRGNRYRKRFIFNSYIVNVLTCTKCNKLCLVKAMAQLYNHDDKCVQEFDRLLFKNATLYKPPNCENLKNKDKLCFKLGNCKGTNPICNY